MKKPSLQQAPVSLTGLFGDDDSDDDTHTGQPQQSGSEGGHFENESEVKIMDFCGVDLQIRQMAWHRANANQVWPGTFTLLDHIFRVSVDATSEYRYKNGLCLELGSATGALSIALQKKDKDFEVITW